MLYYNPSLERHSSQKTVTGNNDKKGEIPIEKNILVIDQHGNTLHHTWPKRAKQLVKKERAYYLDDKTICLKNQMEETMEKKLYSDILDKIDQLSNEKSEFVSGLEKLQKEGLSKDQVKAIKQLTKDKEKTYRRAIKELRKIYDDQSGRSVRKNILKTARIAARNGEKVDFEKLLLELEKTR